MFKEIQILMNMDHPNIVKYYEYFEDESRFYIVTELIKDGDLFNAV